MALAARGKPGAGVYPSPRRQMGVSGTAPPAPGPAVLGAPGYPVRPSRALMTAT